jgi:flagellar basal body-associated protein FliL
MRSRAPRFKNLFIDHLSRLTLADLTEPDAKDKIRKDLVRLVNATMPPKEGEVRDVFFTEYIIQ